MKRKKSSSKKTNLKAVEKAAMNALEVLLVDGDGEKAQAFNEAAVRALWIKLSYLLVYDKGPARVFSMIEEIHDDLSGECSCTAQRGGK